MGAILSVGSMLAGGVGAVTSGMTALEQAQALLSGSDRDREADREAALSAHRQVQQEALALGQLRSQQALDVAQLTDDTALRQEQVAAQAERAEAERQEDLRRALSEQRARFGAFGIAGAGGSSDAVLLGLLNDSDELRAARDRVLALQRQGFDQSLSHAQDLNMLQRTQLLERQDLGRLF